MFTTFLTGLLWGLAIAAPVGPIGILCIRRTLAMGQWIGMMSGLGAATADGLYGCIAGFGLTAIADFLVDQSTWLRIVGGIFLCYLGVTTFFSRPSMTGGTDVPDSLVADTSHVPAARSLLAAYSSTLILTLTNPATLFSFAAIFAGVGMVESGQDFAGSTVLILGVFIGSALWWFCLSGVVSLFRRRFTPAALGWLNRFSGMVLLAFGCIALTYGFRALLLGDL
ncbi:MAG: LysE/ArgO family amino acid transporter [Leptolyngbyaceae cyanobacterium]